MFIAALIIIAKNDNYLNVHQLMNTRNVPYTFNRIIAFKRNEILIHATYTKWKKSVTKGSIFYESTNMKCPK
jgi:hypothetical protein